MATEPLGLQHPFKLIICVKVVSNPRHSAAHVPLSDRSNQQEVETPVPPLMSPTRIYQRAAVPLLFTFQRRAPCFTLITQ